MSAVHEIPGEDEKSVFDKLIEEYGSLQGLLFLVPTLVMLSIVIFWPVVNYGILLSFKDYTIDPNVVDPWVWFENYKFWLFGNGSDLLLFSVKQTLLFELVVIPLDLVLAMAAALVMNERLPKRSVFRGFVLAGYAAPAAAAGLAWAIMEQAAVYGVMYHFVNTLPLVNIPETGGMTGSTPWAFLAVTLPKMWRDFAFMYIVFLAGLQSIAPSLYEMAKVDGAGPVKRFRYITIPHLRTIIVTIIMIRTIFLFGDVAMTWAVTQGGPVNYTSFIAVLIFKQAFIKWFLAKAAALGMLFALAVLPLIMLWVKLETEDYK